MTSLTCEYALRAMVCLAQADESLTVSRIAESVKVSPGYLSKVMQQLCKAGLVRSQRGLRGGFTLEEPADRITLLRVVNAVDPIQRIVRCPLGIKDHGTNLCPLHRRLDDVLRSTEEAFASVTLADLLQEGGPIVPLCGNKPETTPLTVGGEEPPATK